MREESGHLEEAGKRKFWGGGGLLHDLESTGNEDLYPRQQGAGEWDFLW